MLFLSSILLFIIYESVFSIDVNPCASTWHYYNKTGCCYKTSTEIGTWFEGSGICAKMNSGSRLASLRSEDESKFVAKKYRNGIYGIHAWTGLSQTQIANNWTFTDGSKPWSSFFMPYLFPHNHTSCVEIVDDWLVELLKNTGKTQPTFCYHYRKALCKYCPVPSLQTIITTNIKPTTPSAVRIEKIHPKINQVEMVSGCSSGLSSSQGAANLSPISVNKLPKTQSTLPTITKTLSKLGIVPSVPLSIVIGSKTHSS